MLTLMILVGWLVFIYILIGILFSYLLTRQMEIDGFPTTGSNKVVFAMFWPPFLALIIKKLWED